MHYEEDADDGIKSKTQIKKEMHDLQDMGQRISRLSKQQRARLPLPAELVEAVDELIRIKANSAKKRQMQRVGKLLRGYDHEGIRQALEDLQEGSHRSVRQLHLIEQWRDRLLSQENALEAFIAAHPLCDRQQLRQLIRNAQKEQPQQELPGEAERKSTHYRKLFAFLRETLDSDED